MVIRCFNTRALPQLRHKLLNEEPKFVLYQLDGKLIRDKRSLFDAFRLNTPYAKKVPSVGLSWDAFAECLDVGLKQKGDEWVAILWHDAQTLIEENLPVLLEFAEVVSSMRWPFPDKYVLFVVLLGVGAGFPDYADDWRVSQGAHPLI
jgi:hypothetical protein